MKSALDSERGSVRALSNGRLVGTLPRMAFM
jgi:hypothetical protein